MWAPPPATISSTIRTDSPSATIRVAIASMLTSSRKGQQRVRVPVTGPRLPRAAAPQGEAEQPDGVGDLRSGSAQAPSPPACTRSRPGAAVGRSLLKRVQSSRASRRASRSRSARPWDGPWPGWCPTQGVGRSGTVALQRGTSSYVARASASCRLSTGTSALDHDGLQEPDLSQRRSESDGLIEDGRGCRVGLMAVSGNRRSGSAVVACASLAVWAYPSPLPQHLRP